MESKLTHWKKGFDVRYIGSHDFQPNQELKVTIETIKTENVELFNGSKNEMKSCVLVTFKGGKKPMILNNTNCKIITKNLKTPYLEEWVGKTIILYVAKVRAFGEVVDAIRVRSES